MPWVKLDDGFDDDADLEYLSEGAVALHICALAFCARRLTDGFLSHYNARKLFGFSTKSVTLLTTSAAPGNAPWWVEVDGGFLIRSFLRYNPPAEETIQKRAKRSEAGAEGAKARWEKERAKRDSKSQGGNDTKPDGSDHSEPHSKSHNKPDGKTDAPNPEVPNSEFRSPEAEESGSMQVQNHLMAMGALRALLPPPLQCEQVQTALTRFAGYLAKKHVQLWVEDTIRANAMKMADWTVEEVAGAVTAAIQNNWVSLWKPKPEPKEKHPRKGGKKSMEETLNEL